VTTPRSRRVVVVGAGNIGSYAIAMLCRHVAVGEVLVVDFDRYDEGNLVGQDVSRGDLGRCKAQVAARRAARLAPGLSVEAIVDRIENLPLGRLRADLILACVDSLHARQSINQIAFRLGIDLIDAGVSGEDQRVRADVYSPAEATACLECAWDEDSYAALEQTYLCGAADAAPPSNAAAQVGAAAAALQVGEAAKLLDGRRAEALIGRQVVLDLRHHRHFVTVLPRNPRCRFDHRTPTITRLAASPAELTMAQVLSLAPVVRGVHGELALSVDGKAFLTELRCPACGSTRAAGFRLAGRQRPADALCDCGRRRLPSGGDQVERLSALLPKSQLARRLSSFGFRPYDVFTLATADAAAHFELGGGRAAGSR
jgi:molybdopterin/thiamine biosynthesis adenylyltransferase